MPLLKTVHVRLGAQVPPREPEPKYPSRWPLIIPVFGERWQMRRNEAYWERSREYDRRNRPYMNTWSKRDKVAEAIRSVSSEDAAG